MKSAAAEATTEKDLQPLCEPDFSTGMKVKDLAQMFAATTTQETAIRPKRIQRGEQKLFKVKPLATKLPVATPAVSTAVQPTENDEDPEDQIPQHAPNVKELVRKFGATTTKKTAVQPKGKQREEEKVSEVGYDENDEDPEDQIPQHAPNVKELVRKFGATTTKKKAVQPKGKQREEEKAKPLAKSLSATTAQETAVHPQKKDEEDLHLTQVRPDKIPPDAKPKIQMRKKMVAQGGSSEKACQGSLNAEWLEINDMLTEVVRVAEDAKKKSIDLSLSTLRTTTSTMMAQIHQKLDKLPSVELRWISKFAVDVKLDPITAQGCLVSADGKKVVSSEKNQEAPGSFCRVLGLNRLISGKSYWEVVVSSTTEWNLGLVRHNANRNWKSLLTPDDGYWVIRHYENRYAALTDPPVRLSLKKRQKPEKPQKVGVFVDYEEGLVSFYDVTAQSHMYSFTECSFAGEIYPYFSVRLHGKAHPLTIATVKHL